MGKIGFVVYLLALAAMGAHATPEAEHDARQALAGMEVPRGVACVPDCGDGDLALELTRQSDFLVLAMDADAENVAVAKAKAADAGLLGRRLYVEQGSTGAIPFADNYVDLLVLSDVPEKDLSPELRAEILRVLTPIRGRAVLADTTIQKPEMHGSDWWTHKLHGPNNNQVSEDTAFEFPPILQFRAMPAYSSNVGSALTARGIHIEINDWVHQNVYRAGLCGRIFARSSYNGRIFWQGTVPEGVEADLPLFAIAGGDLLLASGERAEVLRRDLQTGTERQGIVLAGDEMRIKWLAVEDGSLFVLLGAPSEVRTPFESLRQWDVYKRQEAGRTLFGSTLIAWDMAEGFTQWEHREPAKISFRNVAVYQGRLYFYSEGKRLGCLDAKTGRQIWENADGEWMETEKRPTRFRYSNIRNPSTLKVSDGLVLLSLVEGGKGFVFRAEDGALAHRIKHPKGLSYEAQKSLILDGKCYIGGEALDAAAGWRTGHDQLPSLAGSAWCGVATYAPGSGFIGHSTLGYKAPCGVGAWVAGGILLYGPTVCSCAGHFMGAGAYAAGGDVYKRVQESPEYPLVKGTAFEGAPSVSSPADKGNWVTYRGDNRRRGSSQAAVGRSAQIAWTRRLDAPFEYTTLYNQCVDHFDERPVPPICAGGLVYTAGSDGVVRAHGLSDGKPAWTHHVNGTILTSPAYEDGRLFVPSADGWVSALDAATGELIWKRCIAPMERRICVFGQLMNTWPVLSLVIDEGTIYASAGMSIVCGSSTLALDAETGDIRWSRMTNPTYAGSHLAPQDGTVGFGGNMAIVGDSVWAAGYGSLPLCLDREQGALLPTPDAVERFRQQSYYNFRCVYNMQGQDVIAVSDGIVLAGGGPLLENHHLREGKVRRTGYTVYFTDDLGRIDLKQAPIRNLTIARVAPSCDDELIAFAAPPASDERGRLQRTTLHATKGLNVWKTADFAAESHAMKLKDPLEKKVIWKNMFRPRDESQALWRKPDLDVSATALAADAVLVAQGKGVRELSRPRPEELSRREPLVTYEGWEVTAFERESGEELWNVELPAEPLYNGLAVAADGSVIVALRDGSLLCLRGE